MGKLFDFIMTGNWEETQRIALYKKIGKKVENLDEEEVKKLISK